MFSIVVYEYTSAVSSTDFVVNTQICKLRHTTGSFVQYFMYQHDAYELHNSND